MSRTILKKIGKRIPTTTLSEDLPENALITGLYKHNAVAANVYAALQTDTLQITH